MDAYYFEILDDANPLRMKVLKPRPAYRYGRILLSGEEPHDPLKRLLAYAIRVELHMMGHFGMFGQIIGGDSDGKGVDLSMQRILISPESNWVFMTRLVGEHNIFRMLLDNQATLHVHKNKTLVSNIRASRKARIGCIAGS